MDKIDELKRQWAYDGKPNQWQDGFDAGMKELTEAVAERDARIKELEAELSRIKDGANELPVIPVKRTASFESVDVVSTVDVILKSDLDKLMKGGE